MTAFDHVFLGLLLLSVGIGLWRGLVSEVFALVGWGLALFAAWELAGVVQPWLGSVAAKDWSRWAIAFAIVFVAVLIVLAILRMALRGLLSASGMSPVDRLFGGAFGAVRALIVALLLVAGAGLSSLPKEIWWRESVFAPPLETAVIAAKPWLPKGLADRIKY